LKNVLAVLVLVVSLACGGTGTNPTNTGACSITLSGAVTGTFPCASAATGGYDHASNESAVDFTAGSAASASNTTPDITVAIGFSGSMQNGTFTSTGSGAGGGVVVDGNPGSVWAATVASGANPATGSYTLVVSSNTTLAGNTSGSVYTVHGTLDATLPAVQGSSATGTVTLHATF